MKKILKNNWFYLFFIIVFLILTSFNDIYGYLGSNEQWQYYHPDTDWNVYNSYLDQARRGQFLFYNQFTSEAHPAVLFFPLWFMGGQLGKIFHLNNLFVHLFLKAVIFIFLAILLIKFLKLFFVNKNKQKTAWLICLFGGGVAAPLFNETVFSTGLNNALALLSLLILLAIVYQLILFFKRRKKKQLIISFSLCIVLGLIHPYDVLLLFFLFSFLMLWLAIFCWRELFSFSKFYFISLLGLGLGTSYYLYVFLKLPAFNGWLLQNILAPFNLIRFFSTFGFLIILASTGGYLWFKQKKDFSISLVLFSWILANVFSHFLPLFFSAKLLTGLIIPLSILSSNFLYSLPRTQNAPCVSAEMNGVKRGANCPNAPSVSSWVRGLLIKVKRKAIDGLILTVLFIILISGNLFSVIVTFVKINYKLYPYYLPAEFYYPANWLKENINFKEAVLASEKWETFLGGYCGCRLFAGGNQTNQMALKHFLINWFFVDNVNDKEKEQFLRDYNIKYVYFSPWEKEKGSFEPASKDFLKKIYDDGWAKIYRVSLD